MHVAFGVVIGALLIAMPPTGPFSGLFRPPAQPGSLLVTVLDPDGKPVAGAPVLLHAEGTNTNFRNHSRTNQRGVSSIPIPRTANNSPSIDTLTLISWNDQFAHVAHEVDIAALIEGDNQLTIRLAKGRETEVRITMPDGSPADATLKVVADERDMRGIHTDTRSRSAARSADGSFWFVGSETSELAVVRIVDEEQYNGWGAAFDLSERVHHVQLPPPGKLEIAFDLDEPGPGYALVTSFVEWKNPEGNATYRNGNQIATVDRTGEKLLMEMDNLAPGSYEITVGTGVSNNRWSAVPRYGRKVEAKVVSGETTRLAFREGDYDTTVYDGRWNLTILLEDGSGPASGVEWFLHAPHPETFHHEQRVLARSGITGPDGISHIENINLQPGSMHHGSFQFKLADGAMIGEFQPFQYTHNRNPDVFRFFVPSRTGDAAVNAPLTRMIDGRQMPLSEWEGRIVAIMFWDTNQYSTLTSADFLDEWDIIAAREKGHWGDRVIMAAASTDHAMQVPLRTIHERGWHSLEHLWCESPQSSLQSDIARALTITETPWIVILDQHRRIAASGSPRDIDVEEEITKLLQ